MFIDTADVFEILKEHEINHTRSRYVDSPEDAIAFADGRPIVLRGVFSGAAPQSGAWSTVERLHDTTKIRHAYEKLAAQLAATVGPGRILAQEWAESGADLKIEARSDLPEGRTLHLTLGDHSVQRLAPPSEWQAEGMVDELHSGHALIRGVQQKRMLAHLLTKAATLFEEQQLTRLVLDPIRVHDNGYVVLDAAIESPRAAHLHRRLDRHAHDRRSSEYSPSGPQ